MTEAAVLAIQAVGAPLSYPDTKRVKLCKYYLRGRGFPLDALVFKYSRRPLG